MKNQILRLCFGMAWCLSALVPVHAPAAGASATADHAARRDTRTAAAQTRPSPADTLHVVFFTDIHVTPGNAQDSLFRMAVAEANASDAELVIFGGDLTNTGSDEELEHVYGLMSQLEKPWFTVMGNHETTWSESGCTTFRRTFGHDGRVAHRAGGYLFLGYNCGPYMKMADGVVRTEDLAWLGAQAAGARPGERIVSLCHYPLDEDLHQQAGGGRNAQTAGHHRLALRALPPARPAQFRRHRGHTRPGAGRQAGRGASRCPARFLRRLWCASAQSRSDTPHAPAIRYAWRGIRRYSPCPATPPPAAPDMRRPHGIRPAGRAAMVLTGAGCCGDMP